MSLAKFKFICQRRHVCEQVWLIEWSLVYLYLFKLYNYVQYCRTTRLAKSLVASYGFKIGTDGA